MDNSFIQDRLVQKFQENIYGYEEHFGVLTLHANKDFNLKILQYLYDDEQLAFKFLKDLTAIHYPNNVGQELVVTYLVYNMYENVAVRLKFALPIEKPSIFTATKIFETANWLEREAYDFFGVDFVGHPNLIRVMNVPEMDYYPLRKEFPLEDQTRKDKDDDMFGRGGDFNYGDFNVKVN
ncbi:NADH-quinone oxidoreductase subunit C [Empedobacter brevis]|uniref:NADH-quinone oxidoreductase subunit C n=1 Tax=Empedobacter brevis TaxID=247 RepID=A0AAJ1QDU2_9FLAO|nr:NADH-quinone oxidoreductase subunit C [Empedobacter brevis]MDM1072205.1 NADH-quinone oxidoreductase subunit C [Empedobacter brevis]